MRLYLEDDKGFRHEIEKAVGLQQGDIVLFAKTCYMEETLRSLETYMSKRFGRKVIILDGRFRDIAVVPPVWDDVDSPFQTDSPL